MSQQINLFNPIFLQQKKLFTAAAMLQALGLLLAGVLALVFYAHLRVAAMQEQADAGARMLRDKQARLASVGSEFAPRQKSGGLAARVADAEARLVALHQVSRVLQRGELGNTTAYSEYFRALARANLDGLWLTGVSIAGAGTEIGVRGRALQPRLVPGYLGRLANQTAMQGKAFGSLRISQSAPQAAGKTGAEAAAPYIEFSLQSTVGAPGQ